MKKLNIAIIGQGRSGRDIHGKHLSGDTSRFKIVAAVDPKKSCQKRASEEYGCDVYSDYRDLFSRKDLDLIVNSTPSHLHVPVSLDILRAGYNVLCEKPLASSVKDVDRMIAASRKSGRILAIYQQSRFAPYFRKVREVIDSGVLGRIVQISLAFNGFARRWDWQTLTENGGGNLLNTGPHPLDQALQLFGTDIMPDVTCYMDRANTCGNAEDHVLLILRGEKKPLINLEISSCCAYPTYTYNIYGSQGGLKGSTTHIDWKYFKPEEAPKQKLVKEPLTDEDDLPIYCKETLKWHENKWDVPESKSNLFEYMAGVFYSKLYDSLVKGLPFEITPEQVRQQIAVIEKCRKQNPLIYG